MFRRTGGVVVAKNTSAGSDLGRRGRVAYWAALGVFVLIATGAVLTAGFTPFIPDDPPVTRIESTETSRNSDGTTSTMQRSELTTGPGAGGIFGWKVGRVGTFALQFIGGMLIAYLVGGLVYRAVCGHYALRMFGLELQDRSSPLASAADEASATVDERRVLAEDTMAERANLAEGVRPSSEPVDEELTVDSGAWDIVFGLTDLSTSLATVLRQLLSPPPRVRIRGTETMARLLSNRGVLPPRLAAAVERVLRQSRVSSTGRTRARLDDQAMTYGPPLLADLRSLRRTASRAFEQHVLHQVEHVPGFTVSRSKVMQGIQVDAVATHGPSDVVVEVRARVGPGATGAVRETHEWLQRVPSDLPVLLIVPAEPTASPDWRDVLSRPRLVVLPWDEQSDKLVGKLTTLLGSNEGRPVAQDAATLTS